MTIFLRLLGEEDKAAALLEVCGRQRAAGGDPRLFEVLPEAFDAVPGKPFAYWVSEAVRETFARLPAFEGEGRTVKQGLATADDFRFVRGWWETSGQWSVISGQKWFPFAKGGAYSPFYADVYLEVNWEDGGYGLDAFSGSVIRNPDFYLRPGLTWPRRTTSGLSLRAMPTGCIFADKGPAAFVADDDPDPDTLLALLALTNSRAFGLLVSLQLAAADAAARSYEVGVIQKTPIPPLPSAFRHQLSALARRAWSLKRTLDTVNETSHAFLLPAALRPRLGDFDPPVIEAELARIQSEIDAIAFDLYGFEQAECSMQNAEADATIDQDEDESDSANDLPTADSHLPSILSWAIGMAFGRFDVSLATGHRPLPTDPEPFAPLPAKSPGMLPDGAAPFHVHAGILVDDQGHPHDLARLIEEVLARIDVTVPEDVRRWQRRDFFQFHLQRYSKSRRKAPIYWPLSTTSGRYTLWIYYPSLTSQTLYTAINDFIEPKLKQVGADVTALHDKGSNRTRDDERQFEALQAFELELTELRDTLLKLAPTYQPNHDDGVQISAAPLWPLFRHKPWQKVLKDTWAKLEKGDYDWAHLAMSYWPERVREKCKTDKSLAIAHGLEHLYVEPEAKTNKARGRKKAE